MDQVLMVQGWRKVILHFTPQWFLVNMATGLLSILLHDCPYQFKGIHTIATVLFIINITIFLLIAITTVLRYTMFPYTIKLMLYHPSESIFVGTLPMGLATIIYMLCQVVVIDHNGKWAIYVVWVLWWIDFFSAVVSAFLMPVIMIMHHDYKMERMLPTWFLPVVPIVVNPAVGAIVASVLPRDQAVTTLLVSYFLWGIGIGYCFLIMAIYLHRLLIHHIPDAKAISSAFLPAAPLGLGCFGFIHLSTISRDKLDHLVAPGFSDTIYFVSILVGLLMWAFATWWLFLGIIFVYMRSKDISFNLSSWGFVFPIAAYTTGTLILAKETNLEFFKIYATIKIVIIVILWLTVMALTFFGILSRALFVAPCLTPGPPIVAPSTANMPADPRFPTPIDNSTITVPSEVLMEILEVDPVQAEKA